MAEKKGSSVGQSPDAESHASNAESDDDDEPAIDVDPAGAADRGPAAASGNTLSPARASAAAASGSAPPASGSVPFISLSDQQRSDNTADNYRALEVADDQLDSQTIADSASVWSPRTKNSSRSAMSCDGGGGSDDEQLEEDEDDDTDELSARVAKKIRNCSCSKVLDSKKIGNQERRLNDLLEHLLEKADEFSGHIADIRSHQALLQLAKQTATKMLPGLSHSQFVDNMAKLKAAGVILSADYKSAVFTKLLSNKLASITAHDQTELDGIIKHLELHTDTKTEFDPTFPMLSALDQSLSQKFKTFQKYVMERVFTTTIGKGEQCADVVTALSQKLLDAFENMSPDVDLPVNTNAIVMDCMTIWRCIVAIASDTLDASTSPDDMQSFTSAVQSVHESSVIEGSRNIKAIIGRLLKTSPFWSEKLTTFLDTRAAWKDLAPKIRSTVQVLQGCVPGHADTSDHLSRASDLHLLAAERLRNPAYASLSQQLLLTVDAHVGKAMSDPTGVDIQSVSAALQSVTLALPNHQDLVTLIETVAEQIRKTASESKTTALQTQADRLLAMQPSQIEESSMAICKTLESCQGVDMSAAYFFLGPCKKAYSHVTSMLANGFDDKESIFGGEGARVVAEAIAGFLVEEPHAKTALECFGQVRNMFVLMKEKKAIVNDKYSFNDAQLDPGVFATFQGYLGKSQSSLDSTGADSCAADHLAGPLLKFCKEKIKECQVINNGGITAYLAKQETALDKAQQALEPLCSQGPAGGLTWQDNLGENPTWDNYEAACKQHLLQNEYIGTQLPQLRKALLEDRAITLAPLSRHFKGCLKTFQRPLVLAQLSKPFKGFQSPPTSQGPLSLGL